MHPIDRLSSLLGQASAKARSNRRPVLVSVIERVAAVDPLAALAAAARDARHDRNAAVAELCTPRMYWTRPADRFALAGLGAAVTLAPEGADRFATIDREWSTLMSDAMIHDDSAGVAGAGPALMGGFAFDPEGPRTDPWREFPAAHLFVPRLQLVLTQGDCWLTTTLVVGIDGQPDTEPDVLARLRASFLGGDTSGSESRAAQFVDETLAHTDVRDAREWRATVREAVAAVRSGRLEKVVLAREVLASARRDFDVENALRQLQAQHPTCYVFGCWHGDSVFVGATPERLVRADGRDIQASSLAGSVSRGASPEEDAYNAAQLLESAKDRAEHEIVRRALCTGLERLCDYVMADDCPALLTLPNVHHLHTAVHARLRAGHTLLQVVAQLHPTPAVGGDPRNAALRFIREHEKMDRGWYAAPIGWLQGDRGEFAVALRSALVTGSEARLFAGCGVVADSDPYQEYAESLLKLRPMEAALAASVVPEDSDVIDTADSAEDTAPAACGGASS
jgi:isochorismate synthase